MSKIASVEKAIFVNYEVNPIPGVYRDSLWHHLLETVWGDRSWVDEHIQLLEDNGWIHAVRYQFGECFSDELTQEVGELIEKEIKHWSIKNTKA